MKTRHTRAKTRQSALNHSPFGKAANPTKVGQKPVPDYGQNLATTGTSMLVTKEELDQAIEDAGLGHMRFFDFKQILTLGYFQSRDQLQRACQAKPGQPPTMRAFKKSGKTSTYIIKREHLLEGINCTLFEIPLSSIGKEGILPGFGGDHE